MQLTAQKIAAHLGGEVYGNPDVLVSDFAKIEEAGAGQLTFLANTKYEPYIYTTNASAVLVRRDFEPRQSLNATLIKVDDPYTALSALLSLAAQMLKPSPKGIEQPCFIASDVAVPEDAYIGAFAYVAPGAVLGKNVKIYPNSYIGHGVSIGDDTTVYAGVKIYYGCTIGRRCVIHSGAVIGADGFGFAPDAQGVYHKIEQLGNVVIEDDVEIGANTTVDRSTMGSTRICMGTKLDNLVQIAHNVQIGRHTVMAAQGGVAGSASIGSHCQIAGQVGIAGHITVGDNVTIGAQSGIPNNVASGSRVMGYPAVADKTFARNLVYTKRLPQLFEAVERLIKEQEK